MYDPGRIVDGDQIIPFQGYISTVFERNIARNSEIISKFPLFDLCFHYLSISSTPSFITIHGSSLICLIDIYVSSL
jgi:hypothetical protein